MLAEDEKVAKVRPLDFYHLMKLLLPPDKEKFKGCEMCFPDTIFFKDGKGKEMIKHDKDFCLTSTKNQNKINS